MRNEEPDDTVVIDLSSAEDREAVLAEALTHAAIQEARYRVPLPERGRPSHWKVPLALVVFSLSAYLLAAPPPWLAGEPLPAASRSAQERGLRAALFIQAQQVEAFRGRHGRLPGSLEELANPLPGIRYVRSNSRVYQLVSVGADRPAIVYDSARPVDDFAEAAAGWGGDGS